MIDFLRTGSKLNGISLSISVEELLVKKGEPDTVIGDKPRKFYYYGNYKFGINSEDLIDELTIDFSVKLVKFSFKDVVIKHFGSSLNESFVISNTTKIYTFISFLNFLKIEWRAHDYRSLDYLILQICGGPSVTFNLHDGKLLKISKLMEPEQNL